VKPPARHCVQNGLRTWARISAESGLQAGTERAGTIDVLAPDIGKKESSHGRQFTRVRAQRKAEPMMRSLALTRLAAPPQRGQLFDADR
jgi:hypothetical protein